MKKIFISGGAGFVGSHLCEKIFENYKNSKILILDKLTYAGNKKFLKKLLNKKNVTFIKGDICDQKLMSKLLKNINIAINVAAESHVDNSFNNSFAFTFTNTLGSHVFFEKCRINKVKNIIHVSTDEVYGQKISGRSYENDRLLPTNPYSASKAAAEMIALSYKKSFKMNITIVRSNNLYGIRQYPEKLIPKTILSFLIKKKMNLHGNGQQLRHYLHIDDFTDGILLILKKKIKNEIINFGSNEQYQNKEIVKKISKFMKINTNKNIKFVKDRPFNDIRYSVSFAKIKAHGWKPFRNFNKEILTMIDWYKKNINLFKKIK
tara:strand:- start:36 stop:995 length:960 start_codon:yes stop_codon:yes gene_type:complete